MNDSVRPDHSTLLRTKGTYEGSLGAIFSNFLVSQNLLKPSCRKLPVEKYYSTMFEAIALQAHVVPEPSTLLLFGIGLVGIFGLVRRK